MNFTYIKEKIGKLFLGIYNHNNSGNRIIYYLRAYFYEKLNIAKITKKQKAYKFFKKIYDFFSAIDYDIVSKLADQCLDIHIRLTYGR